MKLSAPKNVTFYVSIVLAVIALIGFFVAYRHMVGGMLHSQGDRFVRYLVNQLGTPPSLDRARILSRELGLQIYYLSPQQRWSTNGVKLPPST